IMAPGRMIDRVLAAASGASLQSAQLTDKARMIQQINAAAVDQWQHIDVQIGLGLGGLLIIDANPAEGLDRPNSGIAVADDATDTVGLQHGRELRNNAFR